MELQQELGTTLFIQCGALILAGRNHTGWEDATLPVFERLGVPHLRLGVDEIRLRFPQFKPAAVEYGIFEPEAGFVMARRAIVRTAERFVHEGGRVLRGRVDTDDAERPMLDGKPIEADLIVMAAGPWLGKLFPRTIRPISRVVRQDIIYTSPPDSETAYDAEEMPAGSITATGRTGLLPSRDAG